MRKNDLMVELLGYPPLVSVASFKSIAHLFGSSKSRCGIYLLEFPNLVFYIGQAVEVVRRFNQHCKNHDDIIGFSFIQIPKKKLDEVEKRLIYKAENLGFVLSNSVHATNIEGETDFDFVVSQQEQDIWLSNPESTNRKDESSLIEIPENQIIRFRKKFIKFSNHAKSKEVIDLLKSYINCCVPLPRRTEYSFWSISCMPSTNINTWPRMAVVNVGVMEAFVIGYLKQSKEELWGFVNIASDILIQRWKSIEQFKSSFPFIEVFETSYRDAGQHQLSLETRGISNLPKLLNDESIQIASAHLNLRVMRKRATIYSKYHCNDLSKQCVA